MNRFQLRASYGAFELDAAAEWSAPATALFGASGSGKTTLLEAIAGLRREVRGSVTLRERALDSLPPQQRRLGWVPQDASLFPRMSVAENVAFAARGDDPAVKAAAGRAVDALEIGPLMSRRAADLSGGERQRVAIARALASRPDFLLLDEPLASIDRPLRLRIVPFLQRLTSDLGVPFLLVTHDPVEVVTLCSHVIVIERGRAVESGAPQDLFPAAESYGWLRALAAENRFDVVVLAREGGTIELSTARGTRLTMADVVGTPRPTRVAVRAEDLLLATQRPGPLSAQNVLEGIVVALTPSHAQVIVEVDCGGERWRAKVTARAVARLGLAPGRPAWLVLKAHAIIAAE